MPVNTTDEVAMPPEVVMTEADYAAVVQWPTETQTLVIPQAQGDESLIDAFMHRIADPSSDADFTFLRS
jgi:pyruvate-formate lyase-activating enzyme